MRVLIALTYYRPHYSGLTIYTERLAKALVRRGHQVTVITSQFSDDLVPEEIVDGVRVLRLPVWLRVSKGVIMPSMPLRAWQEIRQADVVNLHVPQLDAAPLALLARLLGKPVVLTYQCDLQLPGGFVNRLANLVSNVANRISAGMANLIVTTSLDYAENSSFLTKYSKKIRPISPPVELLQVSDELLADMREKYQVTPGQRVIGMVARLAAEKGVEYLVRALPDVIEAHPGARVLYAGQHQDVMGEEAYAAMLTPAINELGDRWEFLGIIPDDELAAFFHICDVIVLPSTNSTEAFGIVQVEGMICGTPAVASDMPGVRQPVLQTKMGEIFRVGDAAALAQKLILVLDDPKKYQGDVDHITKHYAPNTTAKDYEALFKELSR